MSDRRFWHVSAGVFRFVYWLGFLANGALAFLAALHPDEFEYSQKLFWSSIGHMAVLVVAGFAAKPADRPGIGNKIGTMGYLYTLVGFMVALPQLAAMETFSLHELLPPIATALLTSIIGWFFGGEIAGETGEVTMSGEAASVAAEMKGFAHAVRAAHESYVRTLHEMLAIYTATTVEWQKAADSAKRAAEEAAGSAEGIGTRVKGMGASVDKTRESLDRVVKLLKEHIGPEFVESVKGLKTNTVEAKTAMKEVAVEARETAKYLRESEALISALEKLIEAMSERGSVET